jgi:hypothetical protein
MCRAFRRDSDSVRNGVSGQRRANLAPIVDPILAPARERIKRSWTTLARDAKVTSVAQTDAGRATEVCRPARLATVIVPTQLRGHGKIALKMQAS